MPAGPSSPNVSPAPVPRSAPAQRWRHRPPRPGLAVLLLLGAAGCKADLLSVDTPGSLVPKTVAEDETLPSIAVNGTVLHAETAGVPGRPMIVVIHGGPGSDYRSLLRARAFADHGYYVVFYDQRGTGLSRREPKASFTIDVMITDLEAVIAHYRTTPSQPVFLLGHSWGAILATAYIGRHPTAVAGAILAEPGGLTWADIKDYVKRSQDFSPLSETLNDVAYLDQILTASEEQHAALDYRWGLLAYADAADDSPIGDEAVPPFWRAGAVSNQALFDLGEAEKPDWASGVHGYQRPVLFLYSERNRAYGRAWAERVSSAYPQVTLARIDEAGHDLLTFEPGWSHFFPAALAYLQGVTP